jgi:hypothetical protein
MARPHPNGAGDDNGRAADTPPERKQLPPVLLGPVEWSPWQRGSPVGPAGGRRIASGPWRSATCAVRPPGRGVGGATAASRAPRLPRPPRDTCRGRPPGSGRPLPASGRGSRRPEGGRAGSRAAAGGSRRRWTACAGFRSADHPLARLRPAPLYPPTGRPHPVGPGRSFRESAPALSAVTRPARANRLSSSGGRTARRCWPCCRSYPSCPCC